MLIEEPVERVDLFPRGVKTGKQVKERGSALFIWEVCRAFDAKNVEVARVQLFEKLRDGYRQEVFGRYLVFCLAGRECD